MGKDTAKQVTIDVEAWKRNLRDAPPVDDAACTRWFNNYFAFWLVCQTKACKRTKRCAGNADACRDRWMPHVPERIKFEFRATLTAVNDGLPLEAVVRKVKEELARFDEITRVLGGGSAATSSSALPLAGAGENSGTLRFSRPSGYQAGT